MNFIKTVIPEAILCTKETGERPRLAAYNLLVEMGNTVMRWSPGAEQGISDTHKKIRFAETRFNVFEIQLKICRMFYNSFSNVGFKTLLRSFQLLVDLQKP